MASLRCKWTKLAEDEALRRSSHCLSVIGSKAYIFGGELKPREPRDNILYVVDCQSSSLSSASNGNATTKNLDSIQLDTAPVPRVGSACASVKEELYLFSGRGGVAMTPIDDSGALQCYDVATSSWSTVSPATSTASQPEPRSYHAMTADPVGNKIYLHAGCPAKGRLPDLWSFDLSMRTWTELAPAPEPARGGPSITFVGGKLYRMNGFDGKTEQGGAVDIYDVGSDTWSTHTFTPTDGPEARSVGCLLSLTVGGRKSLLTMFGERDPSSLGHAGAGKMLEDVWVFDLESQYWTQVKTIAESASETPSARGWFDTDVVRGSGDGFSDKIVVAGGLDENNSRLGDVWLLELE